MVPGLPRRPKGKADRIYFIRNSRRFPLWNPLWPFCVDFAVGACIFSAPYESAEGDGKREGKSLPYRMACSVNSSNYDAIFGRALGKRPYGVIRKLCGKFQIADLA